MISFIIAIILGGLASILILAIIVQRVFGFKFLCKTMGWHRYNHFTGFDGCSAKAKCNICGYEGLIDSQGNLF